MDLAKKSLDLHLKHKGKLEIKSKVPLKTLTDLSLAYTPGVGAVSQAIALDKTKARTHTIIGNTVAVISDGSAVLGLGNIGPEAAMPVMEGKAILFKEFGGVDAIPIVLGTQDVEEIISTIKNIAPSFAGINLEDISAPRCFEIERRLKAELNIPVFHDDQHGTAIVVYAALLNALKVVGKDLSKVKLVVTGAGAAGLAIASLLFEAGLKNYCLVDSQGLVSKSRKDLNKFKQETLKNYPSTWAVKSSENMIVSLAEVIKGADVLVGVSGPNTVTKEMVASMSERAIVIAMANPVPEIMPELARAGGAMVVATGRSDFPNQVNNVLAFPGIFRGLLDLRATLVSTQMKLKAGEAIANCVKKPTALEIIPSALDKSVAKAVARAVKKELVK